MDIALEFGVKPEAVVMQTGVEDCIFRAEERLDHEGGITSEDAAYIITRSALAGHVVSSVP